MTASQIVAIVFLIAVVCSLSSLWFTRCAHSVSFMITIMMITYVLSLFGAVVLMEIVLGITGY